MACGPRRQGQEEDRQVRLGGGPEPELRPGGARPGPARLRLDDHPGPAGGRGRGGPVGGAGGGAGAPRPPPLGQTGVSGQPGQVSSHLMLPTPVVLTHNYKESIS